MNSNELRYSLNEGKYELVFNQFTGEFKCLRYGKHWRDLSGDKMVLALMQAVMNLEDAASDKRDGVQSNDLIVWADGTVCMGGELHQMTHMSDDYEVIKPGTGVYQLVSDVSDGAIKYRKQHGQPTQRDTGVYNKFTVYRNDGRDKPGGDRHGAQYFVIDTVHDKFAAAALVAYADACAKEYPTLADDLINCVQRMEEALK